MKTKMLKKTIINTVLISVVAILLVFSIVANVLSMTIFDTIFTQYFGKSASSLKGNTLNADTNYYSSDFESLKKLEEYEENLCAEITSEGITLLKNDANALPLSTGTKLSIFSHSSVDFVYGGSGSGSNSTDANPTLKETLTSKGFAVNETLWNFYKSGSGSKYVRGIGVINYGAGEDWSINECPLSVIKAESGLESTFENTTAMFVLSRTGGEGADLARNMSAHKGLADSHYLEPNDIELEIIDYLNKKFSSVILVINTNNSFELGWVNNYSNIKAVLNVPGVGKTGLYGLAEVLAGKSPSGHLTDTFVYDNFSSPAMQNMGDFQYTRGGNATGYYYVSYSEGIYVGYRYYETRYEDKVLNAQNVGDYNYSQTVQYPFGYGLSYASFAWSDFSMTQPNENGDITVKVTVKNTQPIGGFSGKEVVQLYFQSPYTAYDKTNKVEKSAVELCGFAKTPNLVPQQEYKVEIKVNLEQFKSYDSTTAKTYFLDAGNYLLTVAPNAHVALNNMLTYKGKSVADGMTENGNVDFVDVYNNLTADFESYSKDISSETDITNQFDHATLNDITYLTRSDWTGTYPETYATGRSSSASAHSERGGYAYQREATDSEYQKLTSKDSLNPEANTKYTSMPENGQNNGVELIDLRGLSFDDKLWEDLLKNITLKELAKLVAQSGYCTPKMDSINKPYVTDLDGPAGLNEIVRHGSVAMAWPTELILACSWNEDLAKDMGRCIGEDGLYTNTVGWYAPGMNIHRTPFAGRNFEYYSEDSYISGVMGSAEVVGASEKGMYAFIKHFALNDQELYRDKNGIATWANEQTIREIYLEPFEMAVKSGEIETFYNKAVLDDNGKITSYIKTETSVPACMGVMSSFNRIGATWAGGNYNLLTNVLRKEWNFNGFIISDYDVQGYMDTVQMLIAGGDAKLSTTGTNSSVLTVASDANFAMEAAKHVLYCVANSAAMNGFVHGVEAVEGFAYYKAILIAYDVFIVIVMGVITTVIVKRIKNKDQNDKNTVDNVD